MTDERFEQLMKQALKPEIDGRDVVIQKNTNNYKNRMKRKRRLRVCITAGIAAAACVLQVCSSIVLEMDKYRIQKQSRILLQTKHHLHFHFAFMHRSSVRKIRWR